MLARGKCWRVLLGELLDYGVKFADGLRFYEKLSLQLLNETAR